MQGATLTCPDGLIDACGFARPYASNHVCVVVPRPAPCAQGGRATCPDGLIDACGFAPPYASNHVCVVVPKPAP